MKYHTPAPGKLATTVPFGALARAVAFDWVSWSQVPARFKALGQVNGKQYYVPWDWGYTSILYRTDKVKGGIDSWNALFDPRHRPYFTR